MKKVEKGKKNHIFKIFVCVNIKQIIILTKTKVTCFQLHIYPCFSFFLCGWSAYSLWKDIATTLQWHMPNKHRTDK